jgi:alcohol dehydrogenase
MYALRMRAVYYDEFRSPPRIEDVPLPQPAPDAVVVRVGASGLCLSDWHGWMGHDPDIRLPHVPGHELAGVVTAVGAEVKRWRAGDRVTVPFVAGCGRCRECASGNQQVCENQFQPGFTAWGSFAEYVALARADANLVRLPDEMDFITAASLGCRFVTSFRAVVDRACVQAGEWVAVHGCGGVGLSAIMIASALGANVVAIDLSEDKLRFAREIGAVATLNASNGADVIAAIKDATAGGAHVSIDALGHSTTCFNSIACLRRRGRHVQIGLMVDEHAHARIPMDRVIAYELQILGSHGMQAFRYDALLAMIRANRLAPQKLIGRTIQLDEAPAALMTMDQFAGTGITVIASF